MTDKMISIIVIGYNIEEYVDLCLESLLKQDYSNYEIIFVDDGSTDLTLQHVQKYVTDSKVKIIKKENGGIVSARKAGVKAAQGEYITFVDGDDWVNPQMLSNLCKGLEHNCMVDIVFTDNYRQLKDEEFMIHRNNLDEGIYDGEKFFEYVLLDKINHQMFPKLYRREFIIEAGYLEYPNITIAEDLLTNVFFGANYPVVCFNNTINYFYRYNQGSVLRKGDKRLLEQINTLELMEDYLKLKLANEQYRQLMDFQWFQYVYLYVACGADIRVQMFVKYQILKRCRKRIKAFKDNKYCRDYLQNVMRWQRWMLYGYWYFPLVMPIVDPCFRAMNRLKSMFCVREK